MNFRLVLFKGLFGLSGDDILISPNGKYNIKLPKQISVLIHTIINKFGYIGKIDNMIILNPFNVK
jgi:hypothetical protein